MNYTPYFYIVKHTPSSLLYAGSKWAAGCSPELFMVNDKRAYTTSSNLVNDLIEIDGLESFEVVQLLTEQECGIHVYDYESWFLQKNSIAERGNWMNMHNNEYLYAPYGSPEFKRIMFKLYGVEHSFHIESAIRKFNNTMMERYGAKWSGNSSIIVAKKDATNIERYGNKCSLLNAEVSAKRKATWDKKYGIDKNPMSHPSVRSKSEATILERFGGHQMRNAEVLQARKQTNLDRYGFEEVTMSPIMKEKSKATLLEKYGVDNYSKTPEKRASTSKIRAGGCAYNNGIIETFISKGQPIPEGFVKGAFNRRKRTTEECAAMSEIRKGSTLWNDGERNYQVSIGDTPEPHWTKGKIKREKVSNERNKNFGQTVWNDGTKQHVVKLGETPDSNWTKGMLPRVKKQ